jgi:dTMP kinase
MTGLMHSAHSGKFFVLEGIDGCGGETQIYEISKLLESKLISLAKLSYPDYTGPIGEIIHRYLHREYEFSKEVQYLLFLADFIKDKEKIEKWLSEGKTIIADRYFTTTLAYQCFNGISIPRALRISELLSLPLPNSIIYLHISADTSIARKTLEKQGHLDRNESDRQLLASLVNSYNSLSNQNILAPWQVVDGEQSIEKVTQDIWQIISPQLD